GGGGAGRGGGGGGGGGGGRGGRGLAGACGKNAGACTRSRWARSGGGCARQRASLRCSATPPSSASCKARATACELRPTVTSTALSWAASPAACRLPTTDRSIPTPWWTAHSTDCGG